MNVHLGSSERRAREKENLRRAILDAARELFVAEGYDAVTMRKIADRIEYSPTTIYLHFKDKDEILLCLSEEGFTLLRACLDKADIPDPVERLRQGGYAYLDFALSQPHYYKIMFEMEATPIVKEEGKHEGSVAPRAFGFIRQCVAEGMAQGRFVSPEPEPVVSHVIWAHIHGAASLALSGRLGMLPSDAQRAFFREVIETTIRGLSAANR